MQLGELVEGGSREEDLAAVVCRLALWSGHHGDGIATVVLVKFAWTSARTHHAGAIHGQRVGLIVIVRHDCWGRRWRVEVEGEAEVERGRGV